MPLIFLATDFGRDGPYMGQVHAVLARQAPSARVVDLVCDLTPFNPKAAAYLLPAYTAQAQPGDVVVAVVDPGVGGARACVVLEADGVWFVGPDNGLLALIVRRARSVRAWTLPVPEGAAATFHGRDVFAPAAAVLARGEEIAGLTPLPAGALDRPDWPDDLAEIVYIDRYGNAMTGLRVASCGSAAGLAVSGRKIKQNRTFADVSGGEALVYANSNGLLEIAVNGGSAVDALRLKVGSPVSEI